MNAFVSRSARRAMVVVVLFAAAAGIAYAAIPDSGGVYTGCMLNKVGTVRLIDPSLPSSNLMSHCTSVETKFTFNQQGQQGFTGAPGKDGAPGAAGKDGANGVSPTVTQLTTGDPNCAAGGAAISDVGGNTAYVCNGADGKDGQPFSGTFASANGQFSITVGDTAIKLAGPSTSITLKPDGTIDTIAGATLNLTSGAATNLVSGTSLDLKSGADTSLNVGHSLNANVAVAASVVATTLDLKATGTAILEAGGPLNLKGSIIHEN